MATPSEVAAYDRTQRDVVTLARAALIEWWEDLGTRDPVAVRNALERFMPELVSTYGDTAATVAADWYEAARQEAAARGAFRAVTAEPPSRQQVQATARWAVGPMFSAEPDADRALRLLSGAVQRLVQRQARNTLLRNGDIDPDRPRWARVPRGLNPCAWCRMLAGRGAVYLTAETAGLWHEWHDDCWCVPEPVWRNQQPSYDYKAYEQQYRDAVDEVGKDRKAILAKMRKNLGTH